MAAPTLLTWHDNPLVAMDVETTGRTPGFHEVIQIAIVPLNCHIKPTGTPFYTNIKPEHPERIVPEATEAHGITLETLMQAPDRFEVAEMLWDWFQNLELIPGKKLLPLTHGGTFDLPFISDLLTPALHDEIFGYPGRDTMSLVVALMDKAAYSGQKINFRRAGLSYVCEDLGIQFDGHHDALADALATAEVYRTLLGRGDWW